MKTLLVIVTTLICTLVYAEKQDYILTKGISSPSFVFLHGDTRTGKNFSTYTKFKKYTTLFPSASEKTWHIHETKKYKSKKAGLISLITKLQKNNELSKDIVLVGFSTGGILAMDIACNSKLKAKGLAMFAANYSPGIDCDYPVKTLLVHGTKDPFMKFNKEKTFKKIRVASGKGTQNYFIENSQCIFNKQIDMDNDKKDKTKVKLETYKCPKKLLTVTIEGAGHTWPGLKNKFIASKIIGLSSAEINGNDLLIDYFVKGKY